MPGGPEGHCPPLSYYPSAPSRLPLLPGGWRRRSAARSECISLFFSLAFFFLDSSFQSASDGRNLSISLRTGWKRRLINRFVLGLNSLADLQSRGGEEERTEVLIDSTLAFHSLWMFVCFLSLILVICFITLANSGGRDSIIVAARFAEGTSNVC